MAYGLKFIVEIEHNGSDIDTHFGTASHTSGYNIEKHSVDRFTMWFAFMKSLNASVHGK